MSVNCQYSQRVEDLFQTLRGTFRWDQKHTYDLLKGELVLIRSGEFVRVLGVRPLDYKNEAGAKIIAFSDGTILVMEPPGTVQKPDMVTIIEPN